WANRRMWRSRKHTPEHETAQGLRLLHGLGLPARWRFPERQDWTDLLEWHASSVIDLVPEGLDGAVLLHPGNHGSANGWALTRFEELSKALLAEGVSVVVTGSPQERSDLTPWLARMSGTPGFMDAVGAWTLTELMDAVTQVRCVVASSTGPLHMASAQGTPTVGLYRSDAPFWPQRWGPLGPGEVLVTSELEAEGGLNLPVEDVLAAVQRARAQAVTQSG
ncbi:MAG: glycosyltransferase family 9 protein, partial [Flavobacteriales bacterium]